MGVTTAGRTLPIVTDEPSHPYEPSLLRRALSAPGLTVLTGAIDHLLEWGLTNSLWVFPMATSCCGIELMAAAASRVDLDRMGTIVRATPRQADVMVVAGTITTKMAPRVLALWEQMPEPKWCIAMGSCAISGDFYRNLYSVVPGIDTVIPVDVYVPGCPPNPEALMHGLLRLQEKVRAAREGKAVAREAKPPIDLTRPTVARVGDPSRAASVGAAQEDAAMNASSLDASDERGEEAEAAPAKHANGVDGVSDLEAIYREHGATEMPKDAAPIVDATKHVALASRLRAAGFVQLVYVVATHWPEKTKPKPQKERIEVAYALRTIGRASRLASWRLVLEDRAAAPSLVGTFAGADWQEREQFDLVGVRFEGHPDLRRIMMADDYDGHPLRKDFAADKGCPPWR